LWVRGQESQGAQQSGGPEKEEPCSEESTTRKACDSN